MKVNVEERVVAARSCFNEGYNCCQSVCLAYADLYTIDTHVLATLSTSFGGGMGRLREVCGAVSGMSLLAGLHLPHIDLSNKERKKENYALVQQLANRFKEENGSYICRELLSLPKGIDDDPVPSQRTVEYYKRRPCAEYVAVAARIYGEMLNRESEEQTGKK